MRPRHSNVTGATVVTQSEPPPPPPPPDGGPAGGSAFAEPRALHPMSILLGIPIAQLVQALIFPAAAVIATAGAFTFAAVGVLLVIGLVARAIAWHRFRFSFDGTVVRVSSGVLSRQYRSVDVARIQQVELDRPFLHRLVGVASIRIETAGSASEPEVELRVLAERDAVAFRRAVRASKARLTGVTEQDVDTPAVEILRVPNRHVALAAVTGVQLLVFPAVLAGGLQLLGGLVTGAIERTVAWLVEVTSQGPDALTGRWTAFAAVFGALVVTSMVVAVVVALLRDGNFRLEQQDGDLVARRGLLGTRDSTVPVHRIQLVEVLRNPVRRMLGVATLRIHSAGGSAGADRRVAVPLLRTDDAYELVKELLGVDELPDLVRHPRAACRRALWRWERPALFAAGVTWAAAVTIPLLASFAPTLRFGAVALLVVAAVLAVIEYRHLAHGLDDTTVVARRGAISLATVHAPVRRIQAVSVRANIFQRRLKIACVTAHVAGPAGDVDVLDASAQTADELAGRLRVYAAGHVTTE